MLSSPSCWKGQCPRGRCGPLMMDRVSVDPSESGGFHGLVTKWDGTMRGAGSADRPACVYGRRGAVCRSSTRRSPTLRSSAPGARFGAGYKLIGRLGVSCSLGSCGLGIEDSLGEVIVLTNNPKRVLDEDVAAKFLQDALNQPQIKSLLPDEHFTGDGTPIEVWMSTKRFRPKGSEEPPVRSARRAERAFHSEQRTNQSHPSAMPVGLRRPLRWHPPESMRGEHRASGARVALPHS
jgi:hypothetical protein